MGPSQLAGQEWWLGDSTNGFAGTFCFLASAASTRELQEQIVGRHHSLADTSADKVLVFWTSRYNTPPPIDQAASQQRAWDEASIDNDV